MVWWEDPSGKHTFWAQKCSSQNYFKWHFLHFAVVVFLLHAEKSLLSFEDSHLDKTDKERKCRQYTLAKNLEKSPILYVKFKCDIFGDLSMLELVNFEKISLLA